MNDHKQPVFLYRIARADAAQLRDLLATLFPQGGWAYGGAAIWDTRSEVAPLRPIKPFATVAEVEVSGDFGHAFNNNLELRWKRLDSATYDLLVMAEQPQEQLAIEPLPHEQHHLTWTKGDTFAALQGAGHKPLLGKHYRGQGGGIVLVRYTGVKEP
ncbi:MAG: hypothetical protein OHK0022_08210 [Roseiflexaceae bacterium]